MCNRVMFAARTKKMGSMLERLFAELKSRSMLPVAFTGFSWGYLEGAVGIGRVRVIGAPTQQRSILNSLLAGDLCRHGHFTKESFGSVSSGEPYQHSGGWITIDSGLASLGGVPEEWCMPLVVAAALLAECISDAQASTILAQANERNGRDAMLLVEFLRYPPLPRPVQLPPIRRPRDEHHEPVVARL